MCARTEKPSPPRITVRSERLPGLALADIAVINAYQAWKHKYMTPEMIQPYDGLGVEVDVDHSYDGMIVVGGSAAGGGAEAQGCEAARRRRWYSIAYGQISK